VSCYVLRLAYSENNSYVLGQDDRELNFISIGVYFVVYWDWCVDMWVCWKCLSCYDSIINGDAFNEKETV